MIDAHCHLGEPAFSASGAGEGADARAERSDSVTAWLLDARARGVNGHVLAGVSPAQWDRARRLCAAHPGLWWTAGIHPAWAAGADDLENALLCLGDVVGDSRPCAIGECGLDKRFAEPERQRWALREQLALARQAELPVVLHIVGAHGEAIQLLTRDGLPRAGGLVHSFAGPPELAARYIALGLHLSVGASVVATGRRKARLGLRTIPTERLLVETDAPDQRPPWAPLNGTWLPELLQRVAEVRESRAEALAIRTDATTRVVLGLDSA